MSQLGYDVAASTLRERLERKGERREVFVAESDGKVLGWAAISVDETFVEGFAADLEGLVVDESVRGAGLGKLLLDAAENWARERGCGEMRVRSNVVRERAHAFYHRNGYATIKTQRNLRKRLEASEPKEDAALAIRVVGDTHDFTTLRNLFVEYESDLPPHLRHGNVPSLAELTQTYAGKDRAFLALLEGAPIGCVAVREFDAQTALLLRLYVTPSGRGLGAARALVEAAIEFAQARAYRRIALDTNKQALEPAYRLYRSLGFVECEPFAAVTYECPTFMELALET